MKKWTSIKYDEEDDDEEEEEEKEELNSPHVILACLFVLA
jgi:hypothetical protein